MKVKLLTNANQDKVICCEDQHTKLSFFFPVLVRGLQSEVLDDDLSKGFEGYDEAMELACFAWENKMFDETLYFSTRGNLNPLYTTARRCTRATALQKLREMQERNWKTR
jgi:hypothetical protein